MSGAKYIVFIVVLVGACLTASAQNKGQLMIDSLMTRLPLEKEDSNRASITNMIAALYFNYDIDKAKSLAYAEKGLELAKKAGALRQQAQAHNYIGNNLVQNGNYPLALEHYLLALRIAEQINNKRLISDAYGIIGTVYSFEKEFPKALEYYLKAEALCEERKDTASLILNRGRLSSLYSNMKDNALALQYLEKNLSLARLVNDKVNVSYCMMSMGSIYGKTGKYDSSVAYLRAAIRLGQDAESRRYLTNMYSTLASTFIFMLDDSTYKMPDKSRLLDSAIYYYSLAVERYMRVGNMQFNSTLQNLADAYARKGDLQKALDLYRQHIKFKDSIFSDTKTKELARKELDYIYALKQDSLKLESTKKELALQKEMQLTALRYEYEKKQAQAKTEKEREQLRFEETLKREKIENDYHTRQMAAEEAQKRKDAFAVAQQEKKDALAAAELHRQQNLINAALGGAGLLFIALLTAGYAYRQKRKDNRLIAEEKKRAQDLLLNILPASVASELQTTGTTDARQYDEVTVLFTDFVNFTRSAEQMTPKELVQELHECFTAFDEIIERNQLEKIKTIGDAYMAVCGLPQADERHAQRTVQAALEIRDMMAGRKKESDTFDVRIGVNSGTVVAGVVGVKKFAYDIWGDTVNMAARMESSGVPGKVNISRSTYALVSNSFSCEHRGRISAKNKGEVDMYFVEFSGAAR